jgi:hypothetical protein
MRFIMATLCRRCHKHIGFFEGLMLQGAKDLCRICQLAIEEEIRWQQEEARRQFLAAIRRGYLPPIRFHRFYLDTDEACHLDVRAFYHKQMKTQEVVQEGNLIATSKKLYFLTKDKSTTIQWGNVMRIDTYHAPFPYGGIALVLARGSGAGFYAVDDWELVATILDTEVKIAKRQLLPPGNMFQQQASRAIPQHIISQVFQMYNGRCAECGAFGKGVDLQIDHRIPFSKGGSNDIGNLQLLCGVCNKKKGARI